MLNKFDKINNLQLLCSQRMCTVKDIQAEALLSMSHSFAANYLHIKKESEYQENFKSYILNEEDEEAIDKFMNNLFEYLSEKIITYPRMLDIVDNSTKSPQLYMKAKLVEPINFFYKVLADSLVDRLSYVSNYKEEQTYIPSMLAILIIVDFREKASYKFEKYDFIKNEDLDKLSEIYYRLHKNLKNEQNISMTAPITEQTVIRKMSDVSIFMVEKLLSSDYNKSFKKMSNSKNKKR